MTEKKMDEVELIKAIGGGLTKVGAAAVIGYLLKTQDLSGIKGFSKAFVGLGIIGLSHAAGDAAAKAIEKDVDGVSGAIKFFNKRSGNAVDENGNPVEAEEL